MQQASYKLIVCQLCLVLRFVDIYGLLVYILSVYYIISKGLVDAEKLEPGDLVGVNKDSYLILDTLPPG